MSENKKSVMIRVYLVYAFMCLFGMAIIARVWFLQNVQGDFWREKAKSQTIRMVDIEPDRGNIFSADGSLLATSVPIYDLRMDMKAEGLTDALFNAKVDSLSMRLSQYFGDKPAREYKRMLTAARRDGKRYFLLKKNVSHKQLLVVQKFPLYNMGRNKSGLVIEQKSRRVKPFELLASRTIGYRKDQVGSIGIEGAFHKELKGVEGHRLMQRLSGNVWKPLNEENEIDPKNGYDVVTTIDVNLQDVAENSLLEQLNAHKAEKGCAVLMEVQTGRVLAIANLTRTADSVYREDYNYAVGESTEPGSTFKLASIIALMEDGYAEPDDSVDTQGGAIRYANRIMKDSHDGGYGKISLQRAFEVSSNVGISRMVHKFYSKNQQLFIDRIRAMGLGEKAGLQINGERSPLVRNTKDSLWSGVSLPYMSIGYECSFTPLQILTFYNAVANGGKMVSPVFVKEIRSNSHVIAEYKTRVIRDSIASATTIRKAQAMLEGVVEKGTATNLRHAQYKIAGKTGTAQIANSKTGYKNGKIRYQASFVGYFPADQPRYSCIVVVYAPNNNLYYASQVAAPIFKEIADKVYATSIDLHKEITEEDLLAGNVPSIKKGDYTNTEQVVKTLKIPSRTEAAVDRWIQPVTKEEEVVYNQVSVRHDLVPSVTGMGLRDAVYLLESLGLQVRVIGRGTVTQQNPSPGTKFEKGQEIIIQLGT